jgi:small GTP-binding protein
MSKKILHHKKLLLLNFWDTAGQERYRSMALSSIKNCHLAIIVYDVTLSSTLKNCDEWWQILQENKPCDASVILVGNKTDL